MRLTVPAPVAHEESTEPIRCQQRVARRRPGCATHLLHGAIRWVKRAVRFAMRRNRAVAWRSRRGAMRHHAKRVAPSHTRDAGVLRAGGADGPSPCAVSSINVRHNIGSDLDRIDPPAPRSRVTQGEPSRLRAMLSSIGSGVLALRAPGVPNICDRDQSQCTSVTRIVLVRVSTITLPRFVNVGRIMAATCSASAYERRITWVCSGAVARQSS